MATWTISQLQHTVMEYESLGTTKPTVLASKPAAPTAPAKTKQTTSCKLQE